MNQILITEKLYITPELKRKKKMYKVKFCISIFLICLLFSYYIYAESRKMESEAVSQQILADLENKKTNSEDTEGVDTTTKNVVNDVIIVTLSQSEADEAQDNIMTPPVVEEEQQENTYTTDSGETYTTDSILTIPCIDITYPVLSETSEELLKISLNKYWGNGPNKVGNYCIVGHNYANGKLFGKLSQMEIGDIAILEDMETGTKVTYEAYDKYVVDPTDVSCTSQLTNGKREMTLITCKEYGTKRLIIKCREI